MGARLQRMRIAAGLTQEVLASRAGVSVHNVRNWEQDRREPRASTLNALAAALGVTCDELLRERPVGQVGTPGKPAKGKGRKAGGK